MDAFPMGQFLEWVHEVIEKSWGKVWAWAVYGTLLLAFIFGAVWIIARHW